MPTNLLTNWVETYTTDLYKWALHKVSNSELAKDLVQDTFLSAAEKMDTFKGESTPKTWLFSILNHKIIDHYRKKVHQTVPVEDQSFPKFFEHDGGWQEQRKPNDWQFEDESHLLDNSEFQQILKKCLDALPEKWSTSVKLKYLMEKNGDEICQELGITPSNFWQIVHRAKLQLRDCVEKNWYN
ncbi:MAG: sigma-70 family RNA polymerase sigma factor [Prolixibacteraceae bacterium]|jgi:RNA polymerase sigma-70 factor (TIGR02943 family)|nr:sigma-70 family RNA polymerase sigma factor [Prolixibacteraceae bacterium]